MRSDGLTDAVRHHGRIVRRSRKSRLKVGKVARAPEDFSSPIFW